MKWAKAESKRANDGTLLYRLLQHVRLPLAKPQFLLDVVQLEPLIKRNRFVEQSRVGTRPDQMDWPVGVGRVGDVTDRPDFMSENRNLSVGRWSVDGRSIVGFLVGRLSVFGRSLVSVTYAFCEIQLSRMFQMKIWRPWVLFFFNFKSLLISESMFFFPKSPCWKIPRIPLKRSDVLDSRQRHKLSRQRRS